MTKTGIIYRKGKIMVKYLTREELNAKCASLEGEQEVQPLMIQFNEGAFIWEVRKGKEWISFFIVKEEKGHFPAANSNEQRQPGEKVIKPRHGS